VKEEIEKRIQESKRRLKAAEIRAELMKRNFRFRKEHKAAEKFPSHSDEWKAFCDKWRISEAWNGRLEGLVECTYSLPSLHVSIPRARVSKKQVELKSWSFYPDAGPWRGIGDALHHSIQDEDGYIYIRIHPWTKKKDIDYLWLEVRYAQKKVFGEIYGGRQRRTFERDLCWYDLHRGKDFGKLSAGKIAMAWFLHRKEKIPRKTIESSIKNITLLIREL